jgi:hypothetical protein
VNDIDDFYIYKYIINYITNIKYAGPWWWWWGFSNLPPTQHRLPPPRTSKPLPKAVDAPMRSWEDQEEEEEEE